jgi:hypothetical protein
MRPNQFERADLHSSRGRISDMTCTLLLRTAAVILGVTALLASGIPVGLYWLGLSNIEGRPERPTQTSNVVADSTLLQQDLGTQGPIVVVALNPWTFIFDTIHEAQTFSSRVLIWQPMDAP